MLIFSNDLIISELENSRPPVLKLLNETYGGNHFIIAKGSQDSAININDPGTAANSTLAQSNSYWGDTVRLGKFMPTNSDLSYITLFIDESYSLKVTSESGEIVGDEYYFNEGPMLDPENPSTESGVEILNAFYYPKPENGFYQIEITGPPGSYQLDGYIYDQEGEISFSESTGALGEGQTKEGYIFLLKA